MQQKSTPNPYCVGDGVVYVALTNKQGSIITEFVVDESDFPAVQEAGRWSPCWHSEIGRYTVKSNALRISLPRYLLHPLKSQVVRSANGNLLDCRRSNLVVGTMGSWSRNERSEPPEVVRPNREWVHPAKDPATPWYVKNPDAARDSVRRLYKRRSAWYKAFMVGRSCQDCGDASSRLEWHHRDPKTKIMAIGHGVFLMPRQRLMNEMAKCDLLCRPCHLARHKAMRAA